MRHYLVILGFTALVWLGLCLSEQQVYTLNVGVEWVGYDTVAYAIRRADSTATVRVTARGFSALAYSLAPDHAPLRINAPGEGTMRSVAFADVADEVRRQLGFGSAVGSPRDSLRVWLAPRECRTFAVDLMPVHFGFAPHYGLYGEPRVSPDSVRLYGPMSQLMAIESLRAVDTTIDGIDTSGRHLIRLVPVGSDFPSVRADAQAVSVEIEVERFVEHNFKLPVGVAGADTGMHFRIYPPEVEVEVWVAERDLPRLTERLFSASIDYADVLEGGACSVCLDRFPDFVRPFGTNPATVQCVVIR